MTVAGKKFSLNTRHWPLLGDPDAKYVFVEMFDYTCSHCRRTHKAIDGAFKEYGEDLAIIALPVPIDRACNDAIRSNGHPGACELAKLSVAVWRVSPAKFHEYHDWMFQSTRSYSSAKTKAEQLVGKDQLDAELSLPHAKKLSGEARRAVQASRQWLRAKNHVPEEHHERRGFVIEDACQYDQTRARTLKHNLQFGRQNSERKASVLNPVRWLSSCVRLMSRGG